MGPVDATDLEHELVARRFERVPVLGLPVVGGQRGDGADRAMMVGNSLQSDILPVLEIGGWGVHVPHDLTWEPEHDTAPDGHHRFHEIFDLGDLAALVRGLE